MSQNDTWVPRRWLPEKKLRRSVGMGNLIGLFITFAFTIMFICVDFLVEDSVLEIIAGIGVTLASIALGFYLSSCWTEWKRGDWRRVKAIEIDNLVSREIARAAEDFRNTSNSLSILPTTDDPESYRMSLHFLVDKRISVWKFVTDKALEIQELGYDNGAFIAEKEEDFKRMQQSADKLLISISASGNFESLKSLIETLKVPLQLDDPDRIESHVVSSSETTESEIQEEKPESKIV